MWTLFYDMHSGGGAKEDWESIFIESGSEEEARRIFYNKFGHNPDRVTCTCCGNDYSIDSEDTLKELITPGFFGDESSLTIKEKDILPEWREGDIPAQGYVWVD